MKVRILLFFLSINSILNASVYYIAPDGNDTNPGTFSKPWKTWNKGFTSIAVAPGDTVFFRGGIYPMSVTNGSGYNINRSGNSTRPVCFFNYPGEVPVLDCGNVTPSGYLNFGIRVLDDIRYVHFKGLTIRNVWSVRTGVECIAWRFEHSSNVIIENCTVHNVHGIGFENWGAYNTYYINCDAYNCCDSLAVPGLTGGRGTGFASLNTNLAEPRSGSTYYKGCRAWRCSDQGFSFYNSHFVEVDSCWSFCNGALETGDGHGFKLGFTPGGASLPIQRKIVNCVAAFNRATGIATNENGEYVSQNMLISNNTIYHTGFYKGYPTGYGISVDNTSSKDEDELKRVFRNNIVYINQSGPVFLGRSAIYTHSNNSWDSDIVVTEDDFVSVDSTGISGPRSSDGSLPMLNFLKLAPNSDMIDRGVDVGRTFSGTRPDLGAFEFAGISPYKKPVVSITIEGAGGAKTISTENGKLQLFANVLPDDAFDKTVTWSIKTGNDLASVNSVSGLVTSLRNGIVTIYAVANDGSGVSGSYSITISNQSELIRLNTPPVIKLSYDPFSYGGFIGQIDASRSFDVDKDILSFMWTTSGNIPVSSSTGSTIKFLCPILKSRAVFNFTLTISDGKATKSEVIPVEIIPYKPELEAADISGIEASSYSGPNLPHNIIDGNIETMWLAEGDNQWIILTLKQPFNIQHIKIAFNPVQFRLFYFDILGSNDKLTWEPILNKAESCVFSGNIQVFSFPSSKTEKEYSFIKLVGHSNLTDKWNCISELRIYGSRHLNSPKDEVSHVTIYPNPAKESVTVRIDDPQIDPDVIQIIDVSGVVIIRIMLEPDTRSYTLPINLKKGIYIVELRSNGITLYTQKLIVIS